MVSAPALRRAALGLARRRAAPQPHTRHSRGRTMQTPSDRAWQQTGTTSSSGGSCRGVTSNPRRRQGMAVGVQWRRCRRSTKDINGTRAVLIPALARLGAPQPPQRPSTNVARRLPNSSAFYRRPRTGGAAQATCGFLYDHPWRPFDGCRAHVPPSTEPLRPGV